MPLRPDNTTDKEWEKTLRDWKLRYNNLFSTTQGKLVLTDMLQELNFFHEIKTEEGRIKSNFAKRLLFLCGGWTCDLAKRKD